MGDDAMDPAQGVNVANKFVGRQPDLRRGRASHEPHCAGHNEDLRGREPRLHHHRGFKARSDGPGLQALLPGECQKRCSRLELRSFHPEGAQSKKVAVLNEKVAYCENIASETINGLKKLGITDIMQDTIVAGAKDYSSVLTKVKAYGPDVLFFVATTAPDQAIGVRQAKELGIKAVFFGQKAQGQEGFHPGFRRRGRGSLCVPLCP